MLKNFRSNGEIVRACRSIMKTPPSAKSANAENVFEDEEKREMLERQAEGVHAPLHLFSVVCVCVI